MKNGKNFSNNSSLISLIDRLDNGVIFIRKGGERVMMRWVGCVFKILTRKRWKMVKNRKTAKF